MVRLGFACMSLLSFFFFKQKTAYEMRISDWSSDVCSSDLPTRRDQPSRPARGRAGRPAPTPRRAADRKSVVEGKSVSVRVDLGGRRIIKKKKIIINVNKATTQCIQTNKDKKTDNKIQITMDHSTLQDSVEKYTI